ncbi:AMP-binding protein [Candidatus Nitrosocosmicus franklandus]|uniref:acetate--CoA ligase n=1 Tax=Candidatus Nitrosocosmicus franklandianus TaxID=1798806 RepID=A0A484I8X5_9ARCH|nr:AMP-binding protein [Candidatus Nitrosocosmicus franklandus]VFJ13183.1 Acetyl-coenzyme A synthetase [Candidatus Nitrosocosmicus franklandus]
MTDNLRIPSFSLDDLPISDFTNTSNLITFMRKNNLVSLHDLLLESTKNPEWYWDRVNDDLDIKWKQRYSKVIDAQGGIPWTDWFIGGKCNIIDNIVQKNVEKNPDKIAFIFVNQYGIKEKLTFRDLEFRVRVFSMALKNIGVRKGDVIGIYLPMRSESFIAIYSISMLGAIHVPIFSGFGKLALEQRLIDSNSKFLITSKFMERRGKVIKLQDHWRDVFRNTNVKKVILVDDDDNTNSVGISSKSLDNTNIFSYNNIYDDSLNRLNKNSKLESETMDSKDPLFYLYTSGTTGKPKGTIQTHGGFSIFSAHQASYLIDLKQNDTMFWYADIGWITGQTWVVYGSPMIGACTVVFEDTLDYPTLDFWARQIENLKVTIFGAAPTAIRQFMRNEIKVSNYTFDSLRLLATTGERLNKEAWDWFFKYVGNNKCPIINLSGGTEVGGAILGTLPFLGNVPTSVGVPVPGFDVDIYNEEGESVDNGYLVIKQPWPAMTRGLLNDTDRYIKTYWSRFPNIWYHGDKVMIDKQNMWYILGRADDMIKVAGHRIDPSEIEEILTSYSEVIESAAVSIPDEVTGESVHVFCVLKDFKKTPKQIFIIKENLQELLREKIGKFLLPKEIHFVNDLPKNRAGKTLRRLLRQKLVRDEITNDDLLIVENPDSLKDICPI